MDKFAKRRMALGLTLMVTGATLVALDAHRIAIAWAWPFITAFYDTYVSF